MVTLINRAARLVLHDFGGLAALRYIRRRKFGIVMFHSFAEADKENLETICAYIARHFEPVSLGRIAGSLRNGSALPVRAITVTVDDGYRNFLLHGHPVFRRHGIPVTLYAVADFSAGRIWLWTDQIEYAIEHMVRTSLEVTIGDQRFEFPLTSSQNKAEAVNTITERLKDIPNDRRVEFLARFGRICGVSIPPKPPEHRAGMNWDELRAVAAEGVEIGCHTASHPILSRITDETELRSEIAGARETLERGLGFNVDHFCYPNGHPKDIGNAAIRCVKGAGFASGVTCVQGLNPAGGDPLVLRRLWFDCSTSPHYLAELLTGMHASPAKHRL